MKAGNLLNFLEQQGLDKLRVKDGGVDICTCPNCGYEIKHERGTPCNEMRCPKCGTLMVGKRENKCPATEVLGVIEDLRVSPDEADNVGSALKNATFVGFKVIDDEKGEYSVKFSIASNVLVEFFFKTKGNELIYDKNEINDDGIKAFAEWLSDKLKEWKKK